MRFRELDIKGCILISLDRIEDNRGFFARTFCKEEMARAGITFDIVQCNLSHNDRRGTLRGMHYQAAPWQESKIVTCIQGSIFDVVVDVREDSPQYLKWMSIELDAGSFCGLLVPRGCAHGFLTLEEDTTVLYQMDQYYHPEASRGIRYDDKAISIEWPLVSELTISAKDLSYPPLGHERSEVID